MAPLAAAFSPLGRHQCQMLIWWTFAGGSPGPGARPTGPALARWTLSPTTRRMRRPASAAATVGRLWRARGGRILASRTPG